MRDEQTDERTVDSETAEAAAAAAWITEAIARVPDDDERAALADIWHVEGFGGAEYDVFSADGARDLIDRKLDWLRDQRADGFR